MSLSRPTTPAGATSTTRSSAGSTTRGGSPLRYALVEPPENEFDLAAWDAWLAMVRRDHADAVNFAEMIAWGEHERAFPATSEPDEAAMETLFPRTASSSR